MFVAHDSDGGAPVVVETNPTYPNLFGRIEHQGVLAGGFVTDHRMLRPGAVHRANGGYLMLPAAEVLSQPLVWLKLKEVLRTGRIRLENPAEEYALIPTSTLTPETIELDLKVVLVGRPPLYELAYSLDEDVRKLFRVKAEFDWRVPWDEDGVRGYAGFVSSQVRTAGLHHFDAGRGRSDRRARRAHRREPRLALHELRRDRGSRLGGKPLGGPGRRRRSSARSTSSRRSSTRSGART